MVDTSNTFIYDAANEILVLQAAIADAEIRRKLVHRLSPDEFLVPVHAPIWKALRVLSDKALDYSEDTIRRLVLDEGADEEAATYIAELVPGVPPNLDWHLETMAWDATRARVLKGPVPELLSVLKDPKATPGDVTSAARAIGKALEGGGRRFMRRPEELYRNYRAEIAARRAHRNVFPLGATPFDKNLSEGFAPGRTTVTAGLPGAGKSTVWFAFAILLVKLGRKVLYGAWEMDPESLLDVGVAHMTGLPLTRIIQGELADHETDRVNKAARWIASRIRFMDNAFFAEQGKGKKPSNERNLDILEGYLAESGCDVVIYDLWQRMLPWRKPDDVEGALYRLQHIHREYGIHGVVVHQLLLKDVEKRADKRPTRESIKGTGAYTEVADLVIGIYRPAQFKAVEDNTVETICLKQRKGRANWSIRWKWDGATCYVGDPEEIPYDPGLENSAELGDISAIAIGGRGRKQKIGSRE